MMKKLICVMAAFLMLFSISFAEGQTMREYYNPDNYPMLRVFDAFICEDGDYVVQGCFGDYDYTTEWDPTVYGFDDEQVFTLVLTDDCIIEMPLDMDAGDNVPVTRDEFMALVDMVRQSEYDIRFHCLFEMTEDGQLTKLIYDYLPY